MNNFFKFSISPIFLLCSVSMTVRIAQYISFPLPVHLIEQFYRFSRPAVPCLFRIFSQKPQKMYVAFHVISQSRIETAEAF